MPSAESFNMSIEQFKILATKLEATKENKNATQINSQK
jgi:hypothetical protein